MTMHSGLKTQDPLFNVGIWRGLVRALSAEQLKLKNTLALWLCLIAPAVVVGLQTLQWILQERSPVPAGSSPEEIWQLYTQGALALWTFLMLPLYITLQSALLAALEHQNRQWKHLLTLGIPGECYFLAKLLGLLALVLLAKLFLIAVLLPIGGWLLHIRSDLGISGGPNWSGLMLSVGRTMLCGLLLIAVHSFIALRWKSFTVAVSIGISATVMGFIIGQSREFGPWFPWTMALQPLTQNPNLEQVYWFSALGTLFLTLFACWELKRREIPTD